MALGGHPGPAGTTHQRAPARQTATGAQRVALFPSGLQPSDAPTAEMAAEAATATVRRSGIHGCVSRMAQEFGDHPDAAAERMRWISQLAAEMPAGRRCRQVLAAPPAKPAKTLKPGAITTVQRPDSVCGPGCHRAAPRREARHEPDV